VICKTPTSGCESGDPGGNRTRDNLIKSHKPLFINQHLIDSNSVKPLMAGQWVIGKVSNFFRAIRRFQKAISFGRWR
jgi:hypothetical protein